MAKNTLAILLGADRGKLKLMPTRQVEITRLSEVVGEPIIFTIRALPAKNSRRPRKPP